MGGEELLRTMANVEKARLNLVEVDKASLMPAWRAEFLEDMMPSGQGSMGEDLAPRCKTNLPAGTVRPAVAEAFYPRNNTHSVRGKRRLLLASCMHWAEKQLVMRPCSATEPPEILAGPRKPEALLNDHCLALENLRDDDAGLESSAGSGVNGM